jgi:hypothetical protein
MTQSISAKVLDDAYARDPAAIHALLCNRVPCNAALVEDPHVVCERNGVTTQEHFTVGMLGVINGVLAANGLPEVAAQWCISGDSRTLLGFVDYVPPNTCTFLSWERKVSDGESCG